MLASIIAESVSLSQRLQSSGVRTRPGTASRDRASRCRTFHRCDDYKVALRCRAGQTMAGLAVDNVSVLFLAEGEQRADEVMARLTTFIRAAKQTLDFAIYDMRFSDPLKASLTSALRERAEAGVKIRFCYD